MTYSFTSVSGGQVIRLKDRLGEMFIDIFSVADLYYKNHKSVIMNFINDAIIIAVSPVYIMYKWYNIVDGMSRRKGEG